MTRWICHVLEFLYAKGMKNHFSCSPVDSHIGDSEAKIIAGALEGKNYKIIKLGGNFILHLVYKGIHNYKSYRQ